MNFKAVIMSKLGKCKCLKDFNPNNMIEFPLIVWEYLTHQKDHNRKKNSLLCDLLSSNPNNKNAHMMKWERGLNQEFSWD